MKFTHNPGHEDTPEDASYIQETGHPAYRADDALWLFPTEPPLFPLQPGEVGAVLFPGGELPQDGKGVVELEGHKGGFSVSPQAQTGRSSAAWPMNNRPDWLWTMSTTG